MKTVLRWIATFVVPWCAAFITSFLFQVMSRIRTPWREIEDGCQDGLTLIFGLVIAGVVFSYSTFRLAPKFKIISCITMTSLLTAWFIYCICFAISNNVQGMDRFLIFKMIILLISSWGYVVVKIRLRNKVDL